MGQASLSAKVVATAQPIIHIVLGAAGFVIVFAPALLLELATGWLVAHKIINPVLLSFAAVIRWIVVAGDIVIFGAFLLAGVYLFLRPSPPLETGAELWRHICADAQLLGEILVECLSGFVVIVVTFGLAIGVDFLVVLASHLPGVGHGLATLAKYVKLAILGLDVLLAVVFQYNQVKKFLQRIWVHIEKHQH